MSRAFIASVIVPLYQDAATIARCLDSLLAQSIADRLEIIVVDDGSRDDGPQIASQFPVRVLRQANGGPAAARNAGARAASAAILLFLDADCSAPPRWAETMSAPFSSPEVTAVMGTISAANEEPLSLLVQLEIEERYRRLAGRRNIDFIAAVAFAVRRDTFLAIGGFREDFRYNEDVELSYRICRSGGQIRFVDSVPAEHLHPSRWRDYARSKFWRGFWRMRLYRLYPGKLMRDDWTPSSLKLQSLAAAALLPGALAAFAFPPALWALAAGVALIVALDWRFLRQAVPRLSRQPRPAALALSAVFVLVRAVSIGAAALAEAVDRAVRRLRFKPVAILLALSPCAMAQSPEVAIEIGGQTTGRDVPAAYRYGGGVWHVPQLIDKVAPQMLAVTRQGSTYRAALAWEVLAASQDARDLERKLDAYPLNAFLQDAHRRGAKIIVSLDAMPRWLAANQSTERLPDGPAWAKSPPRDREQWARAVESVVAHFNGELGLDALYEVWNEPDGSFHGSLQQYFELYRATVIGARRADRTAKVGGPAVSDWLATGTPADRRPAGPDTFLRRFFRYAAETAAPEVGLKRLPVDFVTWHGFYRNPSTHYGKAVPRIEQWLAEARMAEGTPLIVDEWNIAAEPPYPEGDLNGSHVGAAYVGASLIAMARAGVDRQVFQMMVDPGKEGYSGGTFTAAGLPRGNFETFRLFAELEGEPVLVRSSDPWVAVAAHATKSRLTVIVTSMVPTRDMFVRDWFEAVPLDDPPVVAELTKVGRNRVVSAVISGAEPPGELTARGKELVGAARRGFLEFSRKAQDWQSGIQIRISLDRRWNGFRPVRHLVLDSDHAAPPQALEKAGKRLAETLKAGVRRAQPQLEGAGADQATRRRFMDELIERPGSPPPAARGKPALADVYESMTGEFTRLYDRAISDLRRHTPGRVETKLEDGGKLAFRAQPYSVHLLVLERP